MMRKIRKWRPRVAPVWFGTAGLVATAAVALPAFGDWSSPHNLESIEGSSAALNTPAVDGCASHSSDGLTIAFNSNRDGDHDIYVATRSSKSAAFGTPVKLPAPINTASDEFCPTIRQGGRLYFSSSRDDPAGDLYVSREGPKGWNQPRRLGSSVNTAGMMEETATFYEDDQGREVMIFSRRPATGPGGKIYESIDGGPAELVPGGPHSSAADNRPSVTHDGLTIFWDSTRFGSQGPDIWYATRSSTSQAWGSAVHLGSLNSAGFDARPFISWDGTLLTFSSNRAGSEGPGPALAPDIWFSERSRPGR